MFIQEYFIVFPEGDIQEIPGRLKVDMLVDINGNELPLPLRTTRMIVFRVFRIVNREHKGRSAVLHYLELMTAEELIPFV